MTPISVCIIAKNEEENIEKCLQKLKPYNFEIIVVDTGSTDRTKEIADSYATKLVDFTWINDFSAARNFAAAQATNNWILTLDCDEFITEINLPGILSLIRQYPRYVGLLEIENAMLGDDRRTYTTKLVRLYSRKHYQYTGTIHEQVSPLKSQELVSFDIPLKVYHTGYVGTPEKIAQKNKRNIDLLMTALSHTQDDAYLYFQLGQSYVLGDDYESACKWFAEGLSLTSDPNLEYVQTMMVCYGQSLLKLGQAKMALTFADHYNSYSRLTDFVYLMGRIYLANQQPVKALGEFLKAITMPAGRQQGVNSFLPCYHIARIYDGMNNMEIALMYYKKCGDFPPALNRLSELME
ncbi:MAG: glycosyltransferase [Lachnospiraceae bacterium]|jgi:glycosyltransferase involved in cell wall biosynthesis|nr:glycosyltransferase [Lachnospiraceae bacterium]